MLFPPVLAATQLSASTTATPAGPPPPLTSPLEPVPPAAPEVFEGKVPCAESPFPKPPPVHESRPPKLDVPPPVPLLFPAEPPLPAAPTVTVTPENELVTRLRA